MPDRGRGQEPWTSLKLNNDPDQFQFAVVSDRTGGHRDKVFSRAVAADQPAAADVRHVRRRPDRGVHPEGGRDQGPVGRVRRLRQEVRDAVLLRPRQPRPDQQVAWSRRGASGTASGTTTSSTRTCCSWPQLREPAGRHGHHRQGTAGVGREDAGGEQGRALDVRLPAQADLDRDATWRRTAGPRSRSRSRAGSTPSSAATSTATRSSSATARTTTSSRPPAAAAGCAASSTASSTTSPGSR